MLIKIDNKVKFRGELGTLKNKHVVRITDTIKEDRDNEG